MESLSNYIYGDGFKEKVLANENTGVDGKTFDQLLSEIASPFPRLKGFALIVKYTIVGNEVLIKTLQSIPYESCRLGIPDDAGFIRSIVYNPYFGTEDYKRSEDVRYTTFNPDPAVVLAESHSIPDYPGQIFWWGETSEFSRFYPHPYWWGNFDGKGGGRAAMENEALLSKLLNNELDNGFMQNVILKMIGDPDQPLPGQSDPKKTVGKEFKKMLENDFSGVEGKKMIVLWSKIKDEFPEIAAFPSNFNYEKLKDVVEKLRNEIVSILMVPPILAGIQSSGSISKDDIQNATMLLQSNVRAYQAVIERVFKKILQSWHNRSLALVSTEIASLSIFPDDVALPDFVWDFLNDEEKKSYIEINYPQITLKRDAGNL
jgi:hypothetical protein